MKKNILNVLILASGSLVLPVSASPFDGTQPLICASTEIQECIPGAGCNRVTAESIDAPRFIRIDFSARELSAERMGSNRKVSQIERSETVDGKLMLQGAEDGVEGVRDGLGWTFAIAQESGNMTLTASGDEVGFVIFGSCTAM